MGAGLAFAKCALGYSAGCADVVFTKCALGYAIIKSTVNVHFGTLLLEAGVLFGILFFGNPVCFLVFNFWTPGCAFWYYIFVNCLGGLSPLLILSLETIWPRARFG